MPIHCCYWSMHTFTSTKLKFSVNQVAASRSSLGLRHRALGFNVPSGPTTWPKICASSFTMTWSASSACTLMKCILPRSQHKASSSPFCFGARVQFNDCALWNCDMPRAGVAFFAESVSLSRECSLGGECVFRGARYRKWAIVVILLIFKYMYAFSCMLFLQ